MSNRRAGSGLVGRAAETGALDRLVDDVWDGRSRALVVRGEAGVGRTALLDHVAARASGCRLLRAAGVEPERAIAFAGLHQLCAPLLEGLGDLPGPQRDALGTALGLATGRDPDPFLVGGAVLGLLTEVAEGGPLVGLVDDVQWLDRPSAQVLGFVARRLPAAPVALVLALRTPGDTGDLAGLPALLVDALGATDARALLAAVVPGRLDERVRDRLVAETRGNPRALVEVSWRSTAAGLAGGFRPPGTRPLADPTEQRIRRRLDELPARTRQLLLAAAAEPVGDPALLWRAAGRLGIPARAAASAEAAGLVDLGPRVRFRHPLVRAVAYRVAAPPDRRRVHRALAEATDPLVDPDRRAWHRAQAALRPDESVAADLERTAGRARARGGSAASAAFLARAAELTPDAGERARRALDAARATLDAGAFDAALALLGAADEGPDDPVRRARTQLVRAQVGFASWQSGGPTAALLAAGRRLAPVDPATARAAYLTAFGSAALAGRLADGTGLRDVAVAARRAPQAPDPQAEDLLLEGLVALFTEGYAAAVPPLRAALRAVGADADGTGGDGPDVLRWLWLPGAVAAGLWDQERWRAVAARHVRCARDSGALGELLLALDARVLTHVFAGELDAGAALVGELDAVREATGSGPAPAGVLGLLAARGRPREAEAAVAAGTRDATARGHGRGLSATQWAAALLYNGLGRYDDAVAAVGEAAAFELGLDNWALAELAEAAARSGRHALAADAADRLTARARAAGTDWAAGVAARARALAGDGAAEPDHREAVERLERTGLGMEAARAHLVYGEWLRRRQRRADARGHLRTAHAMFDRFGAHAFAERARRELRATGGTVRARRGRADRLTAQEAQVARLAAEGHTNPEIGARLFISARTAEYHLHKVFAKLAITSRRQLRGRLARLEPGPG